MKMLIILFLIGISQESNGVPIEPPGYDSMCEVVYMYPNDGARPRKMCESDMVLLEELMTVDCINGAWGYVGKKDHSVKALKLNKYRRKIECQKA